MKYNEIVMKSCLFLVSTEMSFGLTLTHYFSIHTAIFK